MVLPDYKKGSIVNLMSSIEKALGGKPLYKPLPKLPAKELKKYTNIVLIIIDAMGYEYLKKYGKGTVFNKHLKARMTSVFPATTAAAILTFITGVAPKQHGLTGWFMYLKELGIISIPLRFKIRGGSILNKKIHPKQMYNQKSIYNRIKSQKYAVLPMDIVNSITSKLVYSKAKRKGYRTLNGFLRQTRKIIKSNNKKKFVHAYWPEFDKNCHHYGVKSKKTFTHFKKLNKNFEKFIKSLKGTNTLLIITADHGQIDVPKSKKIILKKHPKLKETLTMPLCGEPRAAYCYVHPSKTKQFEKYVKTKLKYACTMHKRKELIKRNYFGFFKPNPKLFDRIGDYILIMKENYEIKDFVLGEKEKFNIGNHGGTSKEEMYVPLILVDCNKK